MRVIARRAAMGEPAIHIRSRYDRPFTNLDPQHAQIVELRFFGGMSVQEVADVLGLSKRTIEREWTMIRSWLRTELDESERD